MFSLVLIRIWIDVKLSLDQHLAAFGQELRDRFRHFPYRDYRDENRRLSPPVIRLPALIDRNSENGSRFPTLRRFDDRIGGQPSHSNPLVEIAHGKEPLTIKITLSLARGKFSGRSLASTGAYAGQARKGGVEISCQEANRGLFEERLVFASD